MPSVLINADDFGLTDGICRSIGLLFHNDAISNTSVMICVEGAAKRIKDHLSPEHRRFVGVHLQLTPENHHKTPISSPGEIPTLVDMEGKFKPKEHGDAVNPEEVKLEWERQILAVAEALGETPSHLDSHHSVHRNASLTPVYLELASKYGLSVRGGKCLKQIDGAPYGVRSSDLYTSDWTGQDASVEDFQEIVRKKLSLVPNGILEVSTHPGFCDKELMSASSWNAVRENDHKVLLSLAQQGWLKFEGISLVRFQSLDNKLQQTAK